MSGSLLWLVPALWLAGSPESAYDVATEVEEVLDREHYDFCRAGTDYVPRDWDEKRWCELALDAQIERCPGYELVCGREVPTVSFEWGELSDRPCENGEPCDGAHGGPCGPGGGGGGAGGGGGGGSGGGKGGGKGSGSGSGQGGGAGQGGSGQGGGSGNGNGSGNGDGSGQGGSGNGKGGDGSSSQGGDPKNGSSDPDGKDPATPNSDPPDPVDVDPPDPPDPPEPVEVTLPNLGGFAQVLMWLVIIAAVLGIGYLIARNFVRDEDDDDDEPIADADAHSPDTSLVAAKAQAARIVETDVQRLLRLAEEAHGRGDDEGAIDHAYAALLRRLEGERLVILDPWKTNGDYLWELRANAGLRNEVRGVVREVEQVQFGAAAADGGRYASVRAKVLAIVGRTTLALALMFGLGSMTSCEDDYDDDYGEAESKHREVDPLMERAAVMGLGDGPSGARAIAELLREHDIDARMRLRSLDRSSLRQTKGAIVLLEYVELEPEVWDELLTWVEHGGLLIVATGMDLPERIGLRYGTDLHDSPELTANYNWMFSDLTLRAPTGRVLEDTFVADMPHESLLVRPGPGQGSGYGEEPWWYGDDDEAQLAPEQDYVVSRHFGAGEIVVLAEPDLMTNAALIVEDNGAFVVNLMRRSDIEQVEFVPYGSMSSGGDAGGSDNPFESIENSKLGWLFVQILLFLAVLYAAVGIPFARLRDPEARTRRAFAEHVQTLGQRYAQARASRHAAYLYSVWALERLRERAVGSGRAGGGLHGLATALAARTGRDESEIMRLLLMAKDAREGGSGAGGSSTDLRLIRELARLLDDTGGPR